MKARYYIFFIMIVMIIFSACVIRNKLTFYPDTKTFLSHDKLPAHITPLDIKTSDNKQLQAFYYKHEKDSLRRLLIYFHGNAGNLYHRLDNAQSIYEMGINVLLMSYRGYAKSTGRPTEKGIYIDGESALAYSIKELGYSTESIILLGRSLGTAVAVNTAQNKPLLGIVLVAPMTSGKEMAKAYGLNLIKFIAGKSFNNEEKIKNLQSPILIVHGDNDQIIPFSMGKKLFETYDGEKKLVIIENAGHNDLQDVNQMKYYGAIRDFVSGI